MASEDPIPERRPEHVRPDPVTPETAAGPAPGGPVPAGSAPTRPVPAGSAPTRSASTGSGPTGPAPAGSATARRPSVGPTRAEPGTGRNEPRWSVARLRWKALLPDVPDEVTSLLAAPIVVSVDPPGAAGDGEDDDEEHERYPAPTDPCAILRAGYGGRRPDFLAPAGLAPLVRARHRV